MCLLCDPGSELRKGGTWRSRTKIICRMENNQKNSSLEYLELVTIFGFYIIGFLVLKGERTETTTNGCNVRSGWCWKCRGILPAFRLRVGVCDHATAT